MDMQTKILALWGKPNNGKSLTLLKLIDLLINSGAEVIDFDRNSKCKKDQWYVLGFNGKKIGITTRGDSEEYLEKDFQNFVGCDICICATHTRGATVKFIKDNYCADNIYWLRKVSLSVENNHSKQKGKLINEQVYLNQCQALNMMALIKTLMF